MSGSMLVSIASPSNGRRAELRRFAVPVSAPPGSHQSDSGETWPFAAWPGLPTDVELQTSLLWPKPRHDGERIREHIRLETHRAMWFWNGGLIESCGYLDLIGPTWVDVRKEWIHVNRECWQPLKRCCTGICNILAELFESIFWWLGIDDADWLSSCQ